MNSHTLWLFWPPSNACCLLRPLEVWSIPDTTKNVTNMLIKSHGRICGQKAMEGVILLEWKKCGKRKKITYWSVWIRSTVEGWCENASFYISSTNYLFLLVFLPASVWNWGYILKLGQATLPGDLLLNLLPYTQINSRIARVWVYKALATSRPLDFLPFHLFAYLIAFAPVFWEMDGRKWRKKKVGKIGLVKKSYNYNGS